MKSSQSCFTDLAVIMFKTSRPFVFNAALTNLVGQIEVASLIASHL